MPQDASLLQYSVILQLHYIYVISYTIYIIFYVIYLISYIIYPHNLYPNLIRPTIAISYN